MGIKTKKQRKVSKVTVSKGESAGSGEETLISGPGDRDTETAGDNVISMESMVTLPDPALSPLYVDAITKLKAGRYMEAVESLLRVIRHVTQLPSFGSFSLHSRSENKRTTLSALFMFVALASEGLANIKKALQFCNKAIAQDPGWQIPFTKRSEYLNCLEQYFSLTPGAPKEEIVRARLSADIIVDPRADMEEVREDDEVKIVTDLSDALRIARDGDKIFLEAGRYYKEDGFSISSRIRNESMEQHFVNNITGASVSDCVLVSAGSPTLQVCAGLGLRTGEILLQRLQLHNLYRSAAQEDRVTSNASHIYIISPDTITVRDCSFVGGDLKNGGILIAEEEFYRSLLELEFENPEMLSCSSEGMSDKCLRLFVDFCIFSDCQKNCCLYSNNQATVVMSNTLMYRCGKVGVSASEGSSVTIINSHISDCLVSCVSVDSVSTINLMGSLLTHSGDCGLVLTEHSRGTVSRCMFRHHRSAVSADNSDLVFDENCVMDILDDSVTDSGLQLHHSAMYISRQGTVVVQRNNFHNCNLVWQIQHGSSPRIENNNIETCLIGFICGSKSSPRLEQNTFQCVVISIGMVIEGAGGNINNNTFLYMSNGLDVHQGCSPVLARNVYRRDKSSGQQPGINFDIVRVRGRPGESEEQTEQVVTISQEEQEQSLAEQISRLSSVPAVRRVCSYCGAREVCSATCSNCDQISYCSPACRLADSARHRAFCNLSITDLF